MVGFSKAEIAKLPPRVPSARKKRTPRAAAEKQTKREQEGSGSRQSFRVRCCISLMGTPAERLTPCTECRTHRYYEGRYGVRAAAGV